MCVCGEQKSTYRSMLRAHRLRTVIPTEAFCMNGISLQMYTPNGQSSAMSCGETEQWRPRGDAFTTRECTHTHTRTDRRLGGFGIGVRSDPEATVPPQLEILQFGFCRLLNIQFFSAKENPQILFSIQPTPCLVKAITVSRRLEYLKRGGLNEKRRKEKQTHPDDCKM